MEISKHVTLWSESIGKGCRMQVTIGSHEIGLNPKTKEELRTAAEQLDFESEIIVTRYAVKRGVMTDSEAVAHLQAYAPKPKK